MSGTMTDASKADLEGTLSACLKMPTEAALRFALTHAYFLGAVDGFDKASDAARKAIKEVTCTT